MQHEFHERLQEAKRRLPLPQLLQKIGDGAHAKKSAHCPFHQDSHASFSIFKNESSVWLWKCHAGCGDGDEVDYLAKRRNLSKGDAISLFIGEAGLNGVMPKAQPPCDWNHCVTAFTDTDAQQLAEWRGISAGFFKWLHAQKLIGLHESKVAFPVHRGGMVVSCHWRVNDDAWSYYPKGTKVAPLIFGDVVHAGFVLVFESQWDAFAVMDKFGWHMDGVPGAAVFITRGANNGKLIRGQLSGDAMAYAFKQNDALKAGYKIPAGDKWLAEVTAHAGCKVLNVVTPAPHKDANDWARAGAGRAEIEAAMKKAILVEPTPETVSANDDLQRALTDARPKTRLPGPDRLLSDFAIELAEILREKDIYYRNGEIVIIADGNLKILTPQAFRCWAERFFVGYRAKTVGENTYEFNVTMTDTEARGTLAAPQFTDGLRRVRRVNHARLPIFDAAGKLALLPNGYHEPTQTLTVAEVKYDLETTLADAIETLNDLLAEFCFADGERSKAVAVAAMMGLFASQLLPDKSLRPCFVFAANAEGAGKTLLAEICILPTCGAMPTGCKSTEDDEIRKNLTTAIREGRLVVFFDNLKGRLSSPALEAFLSAPIWQDRKLGVNENIVGENLATCFVTGNGMTVSPDMRRRSLFVELRQEAERAEDKQFKRLLDLPTLLEMRPMILAALWAVVRHWDEAGCPKPSRGHSAFPSWANIVGGMVEAAGFDCPLKTASVSATADPDSEDMRLLVEAMAGKATPLTFTDLVQLMREHGLFENIVGNENHELDRKEKSALSRILACYDKRLVLNYRFMLDGKGHARRYRVKPLHGDMVEHGHSDCNKSAIRV